MSCRNAVWIAVTESIGPAMIASLRRRERRSYPESRACPHGGSYRIVDIPNRRGVGDLTSLSDVRRPGVRTRGSPNPHEARGLTGLQHHADVVVGGGTHGDEPLDQPQGQTLSRVAVLVQGQKDTLDLAPQLER